MAGEEAEKSAVTPGERWSAAKERRFLAVLADTANVTRALEAIAMSSGALYRRRATCGAFRAAWHAALAEGYARLEAQLLEGALRGEKRSGDAIALTLLQRHRRTAVEHDEAQASRVARTDAAREKLLRRVVALMQADLK